MNNELAARKNETKDMFEKMRIALEGFAVNAAILGVQKDVEIGRELAGFLVQTRILVEDEAVKVIDALNLAFDDKSEKLRVLKATTDKVSAEAAFMKSALNTVSTKTVEIERLTAAIDSLNASMLTFRGLVDDGTFDKAAKTAAALTPNAKSEPASGALSREVGSTDGL